MLGMETQHQLPLPDVTAWMTRRGAAERLKVSVRTVERMVKSGVLRGYTFHGAANEVVPWVLFGPEVVDVAKVKGLLGRTPTADDMAHIRVGIGRR